MSLQGGGWVIRIGEPVSPKQVACNIEGSEENGAGKKNLCFTGCLLITQESKPLLWAGVGIWQGFVAKSSGGTLGIIWSVPLFYKGKTEAPSREEALPQMDARTCPLHFQSRATPLWQHLLSNLPVTCLCASLLSLPAPVVAIVILWPSVWLTVAWEGPRAASGHQPGTHRLAETWFSLDVSTMPHLQPFSLVEPGVPLPPVLPSPCSGWTSHSSSCRPPLWACGAFPPFQKDHSCQRKLLLTLSVGQACS